MSPINCIIALLLNFKYKTFYKKYLINYVFLICFFPVEIKKKYSCHTHRSTTFHQKQRLFWGFLFFSSQLPHLLRSLRSTRSQGSSLVHCSWMLLPVMQDPYDLEIMSRWLFWFDLRRVHNSLYIFLWAFQVPYRSI